MVCRVKAEVSWVCEDKEERRVYIPDAGQSDDCWCSDYELIGFTWSDDEV